MRLRTKAVWTLSMACCFALLAAVAADAQTVTTGNISGVITDAQGGVLPGATLTAVHTPTGTSYEGVTGGDGRDNILNVRVGPYSVSVNMPGFSRRPGLATTNRIFAVRVCGSTTVPIRATWAAK